VTPNFYFPNLTADQRRALEAGNEIDLRPEVALVRVVLRRLLAHLDESAAELPAEELRRVSGLIFSGARTVAHLLAQPAARPDDMHNWLEGALAALSAKHALKL
jgi:hypothetical protein